MGIWITLVVLLLLAILPLGIRILYNDKGPLVKVVVGPVKVTVYPGKKKENFVLSSDSIQLPVVL